MKDYLTELQDDIENDFLPEKIENYDKIKTGLTFGKRVYWYYKEDEEFFIDEGENIKDYLHSIFSGIIVATHDTENNHGELDPERVVIIMDSYPTEKEYPQYTWFSIKRLLNEESLVEIFSPEEK